MNEEKEIKKSWKKPQVEEMNIEETLAGRVPATFEMITYMGGFNS